MEWIDITKYEDERGITLVFDGLEYITRKKGSESGNHCHKESEIFYLVEGEIKFTLGEETEIVKSPKKINIDSNVYHKVVALSDIVFVANKRNKDFS